MLTEAYARRVLGPHEGRIARVILNAWESWRELPDEVRLSLSRARPRANVLSAFMQDGIAELEDVPGLVLIERYGTTTVIVNDEILVRFKKLHYSGLSSNYPTQRALGFNLQLPLADIPQIERVDAGYVLDNAGVRVEDILISYRRASRVVWKYSLDLGGAEVLPFTATPQAPESPKDRVSPKGEDQNADEQNESDE